MGGSDSLSAMSLENKNPLSENNANVKDLADQVYQAFSTNGFVYLKNHGIPQELVSKKRQAGSFTGHLLAVSYYCSLLAVSFFSGLLAVSFHSSLLAVSIYLLVRATVTCDL